MVQLKNKVRNENLTVRGNKKVISKENFKVEIPNLLGIYIETLKHDVGTITAYSVSNCDKGEHIEEENYKNSEVLYANLLYRGYGVVKTECTYIKNYNMPDFVGIKIENYIVINMNEDPKFKETLIDFGVKFNQDFVTYQYKDGDYVLISTSECKNSYPGYGKVGLEVQLPKKLFTVDYNSVRLQRRIKGRPFLFESINSCIESLRDKSISGKMFIHYTVKKFGFKSKTL